MKFTKSPLEEVVVSVYFSPIKSLQTQHAGLFWSKISKEFPSCESLEPVGDAVQFDDEPVPLPRYKFTSTDGSGVLQLQKNGFMTNWRARNPNAEYPHYDEIKSNFVARFTNFKEFISRELDEKVEEITSFSLGYMNFIVSDGEDPYESAVESIPSVQGDAVLKEIGKVEGFAHSYGIEISDDLSVRVSSNSATRTIDSAIGTRFELRAIGILPNSDTDVIVDWLDRAHSVIEKLFTSLTSERAQARWGKLAVDGAVS